MQFHHSFGDDKAQTGAFVFSFETAIDLQEGFSDPKDIFGAHAYTIVPNVDDERSVVIMSNSNGHPAAGMAEFDRV